MGPAVQRLPSPLRTLFSESPGALALCVCECVHLHLSAIVELRFGLHGS